ncbi:MAG TPA: serine/threonine-protein kinase, partial [bacterium]|nr:serine/threonine-protein kinase [bacterium]
MNTGMMHQLIPGISLLGEFTVLEHLGRGGMGSVYRVERVMPTGNIQYAAKLLRDDALSDPVKRDGFIEEIRTWMGLPNHPNIAACRFFRTVGNQLIVFSEYVDGGTLIDWVRGNRLVTAEDVLGTIIRCAAGLHASHCRGVVHQDVKPANILMTASGIPKITDFGLARAARRKIRTPGDSHGGDPLDRTDSPGAVGGGRNDPLQSDILGITVMGLTPAYCSPEQMAGE